MDKVAIFINAFVFGFVMTAAIMGLAMLDPERARRLADRQKDKAIGLKQKRLVFPIILIWRDRTIDVDSADELAAPAVYIRKGRILTIKGVDPKKRFTFKVKGNMTIKGDVRIAKTPVEMSVAELKLRRLNSEIWTEKIPPKEGKNL